jgi:hypothetical protein
MKKNVSVEKRKTFRHAVLSKKVRQDAEYLAWSTLHGLALLVLEGPLLGDRLVVMVERGLG